MEEQLKKFIALSKKEDEEATMEEYKFMKPTILVNTHCEEKTNLDEFKKIIETNDMMEQITPLFICDFYRGEEIEMIEKIKKYGGICEVELNAPNPIESIFDNEENNIFIIFPNPINAFMCFQEFN